jgi:hypothetical protein
MQGSREAKTVFKGYKRAIESHEDADINHIQAFTRGMSSQTRNAPLAAVPALFVLASHRILSRAFPRGSDNGA